MSPEALRVDLLFPPGKCARLGGRAGIPTRETVRALVAATGASLPPVAGPAAAREHGHAPRLVP